MVLCIAAQAAVLIEPDAAMLEVSREVELLILGTERQEPAQFGTGQIARIARGFARRIGTDAIRAAQREMFGRIEVVERILSAGGEQQVETIVEVLTAQDVRADLMICAERAGNRREEAVRIIADMAPFVFRAPVRGALAVLFVAVEREDGGVARLVRIRAAPVGKGAVFIFDIAVFVAQACIKIMALAALDGVVEAERSDAGMAGRQRRGLQTHRRADTSGRYSRPRDAGRRG